MRELLDAREKFYPAIRGFAPMQLVDVVVPRSEIARFVARVKEMSKEYNIPIITYGHAGDGNVHLHPLCVDMSEEEWHKKLPHLLRDIYNAGVSFGGAISGEHGIGFDKKPYLSIQMNAAYLNILKAVKRAFDPNNILNPGKIGYSNFLNCDAVATIITARIASSAPSRDTAKGTPLASARAPRGKTPRASAVHVIIYMDITRPRTS